MSDHEMMLQSTGVKISLPSWEDAGGIVRCVYRWVLNNVNILQITRVQELIDHLSKCGYNLPIELTNYLESVSDKNFDHVIHLNIHLILVQTKKIGI